MESGDGVARPSARAARTADRFAIGSSVACLLHCLLLPIAIAVAPGMARLAGATEGPHLLIFLLAIPASAMAMLGGYRRHGWVVRR
jgi:hypothetical protein